MIDRGAADALRQAGEQADNATRIESLFTLREGAAENQILDLGRIECCPADQRLDDSRRQIVWPCSCKGAL